MINNIVFVCVSSKFLEKGKQQYMIFKCYCLVYEKKIKLNVNVHWIFWQVPENFGGQVHRDGWHWIWTPWSGLYLNNKGRQRFLQCNKFNVCSNIFARIENLKWIWQKYIYIWESLFLVIACIWVVFIIELLFCVTCILECSIAEEPYVKCK